MHREKKNATELDQVYLIETNLDDMSPEISGYLMETLFDLGALDVFFTPIFMKKGRPGTKLSILSQPERRERLIDALLAETTTFGVRYYALERSKLRRDFVQVQTRWGPVRAKRGYLGNDVIKIVPEFEDCKQLAKQHNIPLRVIYDETTRKIDESKRTD